MAPNIDNTEGGQKNSWLLFWPKEPKTFIVKIYRQYLSVNYG